VHLLEENLSRSTTLCNGFYLFQIRTAVDSVEAMQAGKVVSLEELRVY